MSVLRTEKMAQETNSIVVRYLSWIAQLALARTSKGPGSSPGQNFCSSILHLANRWPSEN